MKPFEIKFDIISEIRHGSPYNVASVSIAGNSNFDISPIIVGKTFRHGQ